MAPAYLLGPQVAVRECAVCWGKTVFIDRYSAELSAARYNRYRRRGRRWARPTSERLAAYRCNLCRCWHLGRAW